MTKVQNTQAHRIFCVAAMLLLMAGAVSAEIQPVSNPNGKIAGTIDGHAFDMPVFCHTWVGPLDASSHDQPVSNNASVGGVEPVINMTAFETGYQFVAFIGGERYKFLRATTPVEAIPFTLADKIRTNDHGTVDVEFTLDCDVAWNP